MPGEWRHGSMTVGSDICAKLSAENNSGYRSKIRKLAVFEMVLAANVVVKFAAGFRNSYGRASA